MKPLIKLIRHGLVASSTLRVAVLLAAATFVLSANAAFAKEVAKSDLQVVTKARAGVKPPCGPQSDSLACQTRIKQVLTGSRIPTSARRMGHTADTPYPIYIIDTKDIARCGAGSVGEALRRCPAVR